MYVFCYIVFCRGKQYKESTTTLCYRTQRNRYSSMFCTERTELKACYGKTLERVTEDCFFSSRDRGIALFSHNVQDILSMNPHAIKVLEQRPELISVRSLCWNDAAGDLLYNRPDLSQHEVWASRSPIFDTIFQSKYLSLPFTAPPSKERYAGEVLSKNPKAIPYLLRHPTSISFSALSMNENALDILEACEDSINYEYLSRNTNPRAMVLLRKKLEKVNWKWLSANSCPEAVQLLLEHPEKIDWSCLSENECPLAFPLMLQNLDKLNWYFFCYNPLAVPLLPDNMERINWKMLSEKAKTKEQFAFLRTHLSQVVWPSISLNPHPEATKLLEEYPDQIIWRLALSCHDLFETFTEYDYQGIRNAREALHEEFHAWAGHPSKIATKWRDWGFVEEEMLEDDEGCVTEKSI